MIISHVKRLAVGLMVVCCVGVARTTPAATPSVKPVGSLAGPRTATVTTNRIVHLPKRQTFSFPETGVFVSNDFEGARLNTIIRTGNSYTAQISPENIPVNDSAWYAFKIRSKKPQTIQIRLTYTYSKHRYAPKISSDRIHWTAVQPPDYLHDPTNDSATLRLHVGPDPIYVAGQELFTTQDFKQWIHDLCKKKFVHSTTIGKSANGKPIVKFEIDEGVSSPAYLLVLSRQHPPEVTGTFALISFIDTLCGDTELAKNFRHRFKVVVIPEANPDGVDAGNWRHNLHGVDLNRDWGQFHQPETRVLRDEFLRISQLAPGHIRFGLDFHSTQHDVFYAVEGTNDLTHVWLKDLQNRVPEYNVNIEESRHTTNTTSRPTLTSTGWMQRVLHIEAVTYEIGDETDRNLIRKVSQNAAESLMTQLLAQHE
jgi:predicted deacylase